MSLASRQRSRDWVIKTNSATPDWAKDQIARQGRIIALNERYRSAPAASVEKLSARVAYARALALLNVVFSKKAATPELSKLQLRTKA